MVKPSKSNSFLKNVVTLATGTTLAQAIPAIISPLLTRLYTPADFGLLALFASVTSLFSNVVTGKYELAIILPKEEQNARRLVRLSLLLTVYGCIALWLMAILLHRPILSLFKDQRISPWLYVIPLAIFFAAIFEVFRYYSVRHKAYRNISGATILKSATGASTQVALGFAHTGALGLLLGYLLGLIAGNISLRNIFSKHRIADEKVSYRIGALKEMAQRHQKFPKMTLPSHVLNTTSSQLPIFIFSSVFSGAVTGLYALTQRVLRAPMTILGTSIGQVYFQTSNDYKNHPEILRKFTWSLYKKLLRFGVLPMAVILFFGHDIFKFVFGKEWQIAGDYASVLSPWFFFTFISSPLSNVFFVLEKQKQGLYFQILLFIARAGALLTCILIGLNAFHTVVWFGVTCAVMFFLFILYLFRLIRQNLGIVFFYTLGILAAGILPVFILWKLL